MITTVIAQEFAAEVRRYLQLSPKQLQSKYLYDALGSSLFEAICRLPWYRITRAENRLLVAHAEEVVSALGPEPCTVVELGCGSGEKLAVLAEALQTVGGSARVHIIDISSQALEQTEQRLTRLQHVSVVGHQSTYEVGLRQAARARDAQGSMLVLLLGSNIGNFDTPAALAFLRRIRDVLEPGDFLLLGADLVKCEEDLQLAYDDPLGVTAAFNKNLLVRINRELGGTFNLDAFDHRAAWNALEQRIEMHLVSRAAQIVRIEGAGLSVPFVRGEHIWTESSYKYEPDQIEQMGVECGFA
ncbi:MAG: L-histidine N(alpha)-methyltransferase, partial [Acidobacteria bacterium]|nr:L-histidine N(alpha)-methyltransferase [Acidobacteriota bacterium]